MHAASAVNELMALSVYPQLVSWLRPVAAKM
jgi:hypothetical protein